MYLCTCLCQETLRYNRRKSHFHNFLHPTKAVLPLWQNAENIVKEKHCFWRDLLVSHDSNTACTFCHQPPSTMRRNHRALPNIALPCARAILLLIIVSNSVEDMTPWCRRSSVIHLQIDPATQSVCILGPIEPELYCYDFFVIARAETTTGLCCI